MTRRKPMLSAEMLEDRLVPAGTLDPAFNTTGKGVYDPSGDDFGGKGVAMDSLGRFLIAGRDEAGDGGNDFEVIRLNPNGTLDTTFGAGGYQTIDFDGGNDQAVGVAADSANNVIVVGTSTVTVNNNPVDRIAVAKLTSAGLLDGGFTGGGKLTINFTAGSADEGSGVVVDPADNGIVVVGSTTPAGGKTQFALARLTPTGGFDNGFNGNGKLTFNITNTSTDSARSVTLDAADRIVVAGNSTETTGKNFAVARLSQTGGFDPNFAGGKMSFLVTAAGVATQTAVATDAAGNVFLAGGENVAGGAQYVAAKVTSAGILDTNGFGTGGIVQTGFGTIADRATGIGVLSTGKVVLAGTTIGTGATDFGIIQLTQNGSIDTSFNPTGATPGKLKIDVTGLNQSDVSGQLLVGADGRMVVVGEDTSAPGMEAARVLGPQVSLQTTLSEDRLSVPAPGTNTYTLIVANGGPDNAIGAKLTVTPSGGLTGASFSYTSDAPGGGAVTQGLPGGLLNLPAGGTVTYTITAVLPAQPAGGAMLSANIGVPAGVLDANLTNNTDTDTTLIIPLRPVVASGRADGSAVVYAPQAGGQYGSSPAATLHPFGSAVGLRVATGDVNGDGVADTALVTGPGTPIRFAVVSGRDNSTLLIPPTAPFAGSEDFTGGGFIAVSDLDKDGKAEVILTPDLSGGPRVTVFSLVNGTPTVKANFFGIDDPNFRGGARTSAGDVNGDGTPDLAVVAGFGGGPRAAIFDGRTVFATPTRLVGDFFAFPGSDATNLRNGVFVAAGDVNGDGKADLVFGGGPGGAPRVFVLSGALVSANNVSGAQASPIANFFVAGNSADRGGVRVTATDADGDAKADLAVGSGEGSPSKVRVYLGKNFASAAEPGTFQDLDPFGAVLTGGVFVG